MNTYVNMDGVENVAVALVKQTRRDFIKGAKILYRMFGRIPTEKEFYNSPKRDTRNNNIRYMYDAWRFVKNDPYSMFSSAGEESIINQWKIDTMIDYYKDLYIPGAVILYKAMDETNYIYGNKTQKEKHKLLKKEIYNLDDNTIKERIGDEATTNEFIAARNYIYTLFNGKEILEEWNQNAYDRSRKKKKGHGKIFIQDTDYAKENSAKRITNIKKTKELKESGKSVEEIAKQLNITTGCVYKYLRS